MSLDETRLHTLLGKMVNDMGAAAVAPLVILGDKLGLYKSLAAAGPLSTEDLAEQTGTTERYVREWCANGARMVRRAGRIGVHRIRRRDEPVQYDPGTTGRLRRPRQPSLHDGRLLRDQLAVCR